MKVLVAPLDWGLGHATRSIPVIREFLARGFSVDLAVSGNAAALYRGEFPQLEQIEIPGYAIRYPERGFEMPFWLLKNYRRLMRVIRSERKLADDLVRERSYDIVFSDNRFGFFSSLATNVYMTHQLRIAFPGPFSAFENVGIAWHLRRMKNFDRIWVPDVPRFPGMAGKLSHIACLQKAEYVGILSRFSSLRESSPLLEKFAEEKRFDFVAILSGPEPMRSAFERKTLDALGRIPGRHAVVLGRPGAKNLPKAPANVILFNHLETADFAALVRKAKTIVSRPGYSTVMDMAVLGASCVFVPTPGQTEQEYLARELCRTCQSEMIHQDKLTAKTLCEAPRTNRMLRVSQETDGLLSLAVDRLVAAVQKRKGNFK